MTSNRAYGRKTVVEGQRLVYYMAPADAKYWDQHWQAYLTPDAYKEAADGNLGWHEKPFTQYLPHRGRILEAGCGPGQNVLALCVRGYECEGIDWSTETVKAVLAIRPDLPIRVGDVLQLDVPDKYYRGYISLGVIEHRREGTEPFLQEAYRVLADDGIMLVSVPYFHCLRRMKARLGLYRGRIQDLAFYQYAFTLGEMSSILQRQGFTVIGIYPYGSLEGLKDDIPLLRQRYWARAIDWCLNHNLGLWQWLEQNLGHMILFVCRKSRQPYLD